LKDGPLAVGWVREGDALEELGHMITATMERALNGHGHAS
jgi:hypothetical protein